VAKSATIESVFRMFEARMRDRDRRPERLRRVYASGRTGARRIG
jgi:hypothetical protein